MNARERLLAVLHGQTPDKCPVAPFGELIPRSFFEREYRSRGMGYVRHMSSVSEFLKDIRVTTEVLGNVKKEVFHTSHGDISNEYTYIYGASNDGYVQTKHPICESGDYDAMLEVVNNTAFSLDNSLDEYTEFLLGGEGITHSWTFEPPYMGMQYYLGLERWTFDQTDHADKFFSLMSAMDDMQKRRMELVKLSGQEIINIGNLAGNFSPAAFEEYMAPYFMKYSAYLKRYGKKCTIHADAGNLLQHKDIIPRLGCDIVEAFTPPPVGNLSLADARKAWGEGITIWINFPESVFLEGYEQTRRFALDLLRSDPCPNKIIGTTESGFVGVGMDKIRLFIEGYHAILDAVDEMVV